MLCKPLFYIRVLYTINLYKSDEIHFLQWQSARALS
jgi:hypothetical protein